MPIPQSVTGQAEVKSKACDRGREQLIYLGL